MKTEFYLDKFAALSDFFGWFNSDICEDKEDVEVIQEFVKQRKKETIEKVISQGKELLAVPLDKYSANWISGTTCNFPYITVDGNVHILESTPDNYYKWVKQVVEELEAEAKRQGKLP